VFHSDTLFFLNLADLPSSGFGSTQRILKQKTTLQHVTQTCKKEGALFMPTTLNLTDLTYFGDSHKEVNISSSNNQSSSNDQCFFFFLFLQCDTILSMLQSKSHYSKEEKYTRLIRYEC